MFDRLWNKRLSLHILLVNLGSILLPLIIFCVCLLSTFYQNIYQRTKTECETLLNEYVKNIEAHVQELFFFDFSYGNNAKVTSLMSRQLNDGVISYADNKAIDIVNLFFYTNSKAKSYLVSSYFYYPNDQGYFFSSIDGVKRLDEYYDNDWLPEWETRRNDSWCVPRSMNQFGYTINFISLYHQLKNNVLFVHNINLNYLKNTYLNLRMSQNQQIVMIHQQYGLILSSLDEKGEEACAAIQSMQSGNQIMLDNQRYYVFSKESSLLNVVFHVIIPPRDIFQYLGDVRDLQYIFVVLIIVFVFILSAFHLYRELCGVNEIVQLFERAKKNESIQPTAKKRIPMEYRYIIDHILTHFIEKNYLIERAHAYKYRYDSMKLVALQSQINPHFIFNVLESINWSIIEQTKKPIAANAMIGDLSALLRISLTNPNEMISMAEEIENAKRYIRLQNAHYQNQIAFKWKVDSDSKNVSVMKMTLQPLIENCLLHGFQVSREDAQINLVIYTVESKTHIIVRDNGVGIEQKKLEDLRRFLTDMPDNSYTHIGLANLYGRLNVIYNQQATMQIDSLPGHGTTVHLSFPRQ